tara:strand:+ start:311 stop:751 length:441 start_codon:yes stop_codon:yes gene_type:complete
MESFKIENIIVGTLAGTLCVWFSETYITKFRHGRRYPLSISGMLIYIVFLVTEIIKSGLSTLWLLIKGKSNPMIVTVKTELRTAMTISLLANSVTLTPGTVTVDVTEQTLTILWLDGKNLYEAALKEELIGPLERKLLKLEAKLCK